MRSILASSEALVLSAHLYLSLTANNANFFLLSQAFKDKVRKAAAASSSNGVPVEAAEPEALLIQQGATFQYLNFLTSIADSTGEPLQLKYLQR